MEALVVLDRGCDRQRLYGASAQRQTAADTHRLDDQPLAAVEPGGKVRRADIDVMVGVAGQDAIEFGVQGPKVPRAVVLPGPDQQRAEIPARGPL